MINLISLDTHFIPAARQENEDGTGKRLNYAELEYNNH